MWVSEVKVFLTSDLVIILQFSPQYSCTVKLAQAISVSLSIIGKQQVQKLQQYLAGKIRLRRKFDEAELLEQVLYCAVFFPIRYNLSVGTSEKVQFGALLGAFQIVRDIAAKS